MVRKINDYLYAIKVRLSGSPLRDLNSYVIRSPERNLLVDTGFNTPECLDDLRRGIAELGLDIDKTDVLATHFHADHSGLIWELASLGCGGVYMGEIDKAWLEENQGKDGYWMGMAALFIQEGFPRGALEECMRADPGRTLALPKRVPIIPLRDGQIITVGDIRLQCVHTPGHTPGHLCLYNPRDKFMLLGDHVLFDITPNITTWLSLRNSLKSYLQSLRMIRGFDVQIPLPGHRECTLGFTERVDALLAHHGRRLQETLDIVAARPGVAGYEVAAAMRWSIRAKSWQEFPPAQKWFAMGETLAHLYYLEENGDIHRETRGDEAFYTLV